MGDNVDFGGDVDRSWTANAQGDFATVTDINCAEQAVYNRLITKLGELEQFGYTNYGNQANEIIGDTNIPVAKELIILYTTVCLLQDPQVQNINSINVDYNVNSFQVNVDVQLIGEDTPTNIVFKKE